MKYPIQRQPGSNRQSVRFANNNTAVIRSTKTITLGSIGTGGVAYQWWTLDPLNEVVTNPVSSIAGAFEFYRLMSASVDFVPNGGFSQPGSVQWCYIANPELMQVINAGNDAQRSSIITNEQNVTNISWAAGGTKVMSNNRVTSRKWYSVNAVLQNTADDFDRSIQAMFAMRLEGPASQVVYGKLVFHLTYEFSGLGTSGVNTLLRVVQNPRISYPVDGEEGYPDKVTLFNRRLGEQVYVKEVSPDPPPEGGVVVHL